MGASASRSSQAAGGPGSSGWSRLSIPSARPLTQCEVAEPEQCGRRGHLVSRTAPAPSGHSRSPSRRSEDYGAALDRRSIGVALPSGGRGPVVAAADIAPAPVVRVPAAPVRGRLRALSPAALDGHGGARRPRRRSWPQCTARTDTRCGSRWWSRSRAQRRSSGRALGRRGASRRRGCRGRSRPCRWTPQCRHVAPWCRRRSAVSPIWPQ